MLGKEWTVVKVPYGGGYCSLNLARPKDAKYAPDALQKEFKRQSVFMTDNGAMIKNAWWNSIDTNSRRCNASDGWAKINARLVYNASNLFQSQKNLLFLGGSHTITYSTFRAMKNVFGPQTGLIVFDAHPDCCRKADWPVHSDWLRDLIVDFYLQPENVLIIGLRQIEKSEREFLNEYNIAHWCTNPLRRPDDFSMDNLSVIWALNKLRKLEATYLSVDIDVVSGVFAPGTGCPSVGGFTDRKLINLVKQIKNALPNLKAADIVEINPLNWWQKKILRYDATVDLGVKLIKEIIS